MQTTDGSRIREAHTRKEPRLTLDYIADKDGEMALASRLIQGSLRNLKSKSPSSRVLFWEFACRCTPRAQSRCETREDRKSDKSFTHVSSAAFADALRSNPSKGLLSASCKVKVVNLMLSSEEGK